MRGRRSLPEPSWTRTPSLSNTSQGLQPSGHWHDRLLYGVVLKGLLTFLGSLYKEVAKTTPGTLVYRFERQTARKKKKSFQKHCVLNLECRILSQERSNSFILYFNVIFHGKWAEEDINRKLVTYGCCDNWNSWNFWDRYSICLSRSNVIF